MTTASLPNYRLFLSFKHISGPENPSGPSPPCSSYYPVRDIANTGPGVFCWVTSGRSCGRKYILGIPAHQHRRHMRWIGIVSLISQPRIAWLTIAEPASTCSIASTKSNWIHPLCMTPSSRSKRGSLRSVPLVLLIAQGFYWLRFSLCLRKWSFAECKSLGGSTYVRGSRSMETFDLPFQCKGLDERGYIRYILYTTFEI